jgi:hypothetical protein
VHTTVVSHFAFHPFGYPCRLNARGRRAAQHSAMPGLRRGSSPPT